MQICSSRKWLWVASRICCEFWSSTNLPMVILSFFQTRNGPKWNLKICGTGILFFARPEPKLKISRCGTGIKKLPKFWPTPVSTYFLCFRAWILPRLCDHNGLLSRTSLFFWWFRPDDVWLGCDRDDDFRLQHFTLQSDQGCWPGMSSNVQYLYVNSFHSTFCIHSAADLGPCHRLESTGPRCEGMVQNLLEVQFGDLQQSMVCQHNQT